MKDVYVKQNNVTHLKTGLTIPAINSPQDAKKVLETVSVYLDTLSAYLTPYGEECRLWPAEDSIEETYLFLTLLEEAE